MDTFDSCSRNECNHKLGLPTFTSTAYFLHLQLHQIHHCATGASSPIRKTWPYEMFDRSLFDLKIFFEWSLPLLLPGKNWHFGSFGKSFFVYTIHYYRLFFKKRPYGSIITSHSYPLQGPLRRKLIYSWYMQIWVSMFRLSGLEIVKELLSILFLHTFSLATSNGLKTFGNSHWLPLPLSSSQSLKIV